MLRLVYDNVMAFPGAIISGLCVYFVLANLLVPSRITVTASVIISIIVFGLTNFYLRDNNTRKQSHKPTIKGPSQSTRDNRYKNLIRSSEIIFVAVYATLLIIAGFVSKVDTQLFDPWDHFSFIQIIDLVTALLLSFFAPGFAIVKIINDRKHQFNPVVIFLLAYIFSMAITGLAGYLSAASAYTAIEMKTLLIGLDSVILGLFVSLKLMKGRRIDHNGSLYVVPENRNRTWVSIIRSNSLELVIFASLVGFILFSTSYLYHGTIIGDQWFHHGRTLLFLAGAFKFVVDQLYPFFFHSLIAAFFSISGVPSVNAYVSINFLNIMPVFAFYYFFKKWTPNSSWQRAALLASTLFMLGSGFGWVNIVGQIAGTDHPTSQLSALDILNKADLSTGYDILRRSSTLIDTSSPEPTGPLALVALPAGFLFLGLIKESISNKFKYITILAIISILGILSHDEFYLFIIIGSFLPVIFKLPQKKNSVYAALILSILIVYASDLVYPVKYYTFMQISGVPLIFLSLLFVSFMWALYVCGLVRRTGYVHTLALVMRKMATVRGVRLSLGILIVGTVCYFYVLSFIVWGQLSIEQMKIQQRDSLIPWYLFPLKLGVTGLLGLAFVLSYLFKRYEKEVFIFGIVFVVAFLTGPYYNEYRFSKYMLAGMVGFASILVYRIIVSIPRLSLRPLLVGLIMGFVVTSSSLSLLLFIGFTGLALENPDFHEFHNSLERRIFPSSQEIHFLNFLHNDLIDLKTDYVTVSSNWAGVNSKLVGFVGSSLGSLPKFLQSPNTLDSSSLEGFYNLLNYSNSRYIILAKQEGIDLDAQRVVRFALENFQKVYEDNNYVVIAVPSFAPPSSSVASVSSVSSVVKEETSEVAMVYQQDGLLLPSVVSNQNILPYNNQSFKVTENSKFVKTANENENENENHTNAVTLLGNENRITLWSKPLQERDGINYIEAKFRILDENKTKNNQVGVVWQGQNKQYYVSLSDKGLRLSEKSLISPDSKDSLLLQNSEIIKETGKSYILKVVILRDIIQIYLDEFPRLQISRNSENQYISKVGVRSFGSIVWFEPMKIGHIPETEEGSFQREIYYNHYYPLSALALSKTRYNTFLEDDLSAFSKNNVILSRDPIGRSGQISKYLEYVKAGGTLIIINTANRFDGEFSKLLSIKAGNGSNFDFDSISNPATGQVLNVSGSASSVESKSLNATIKSFYLYNNQKVAPFAIEKKYDKGGRIVFVNSAGYFDAIFNSPSHIFSTLASMPSLIDLKAGKYYKEAFTPSTTITGARFFGDLKISGNAIINSSSLLLPYDHSYVFHIKDVSILDDRKGLEANLTSSSLSLQTHFNNSQIRNLTLYGPYQVTINSTGILHLPSTSQYDYFGIPILSGSDMTIRLSKGEGASAQFVIENGTGNYTHTQPVNITSGEIQLHRITFQHSPPSQPSFPNMRDELSDLSSILMKSPQIKVNGNSSFEKFYNPNRPFDKERMIHIDGRLIMRLNHVDNDRQTDQNVIQTQYVTYLDWVGIEGNINTDIQKSILRIPGDISDAAKKEGIDVPWLKAMSSLTSIMVVILILLITTLTMLMLRLWPKIKSKVQ